MSSLQPPALNLNTPSSKPTDPLGPLECLGLAIAFVTFAVGAVNLLLLQVPLA